MENNNDDDVEEEEELLVYANFEEGIIDREILQNSELKFKVIGLDSDTPIVQLGDQTFKGTWNDTIGTKVYFENDPSPENVDPVFSVPPPKMLKYKCMSNKTLDLCRIFLKPKKTDYSPKIEELSSINCGNAEGEEILNIAQTSANSDFSVSNVVLETNVEMTE